MDGPFIFQHDNCGFAASNCSLEYYYRIGLKVLVWPPNSPDLNIVENLWSLLQRKINRKILKEGLPKNRDLLTNMHILASIRYQIKSFVLCIIQYLQEFKKLEIIKFLCAVLLNLHFIYAFILILSF